MVDSTTGAVAVGAGSCRGWRLSQAVLEISPSTVLGLRRGESGQRPDWKVMRGRRFRWSANERWATPMWPDFGPGVPVA